MGPTTTPDIQTLLLEAGFGVDVDSVSFGMVEVEVAVLVRVVDAMVGEAKLEDVVEVDAGNGVSAKETGFGNWKHTTTRLHRSRTDCLYQAIDLKPWG